MGIVGLVLVAGVPAYLVAQPLSVLRLRGGWRMAALVPLLLTVPALLFSLYALAGGSNLWPLTLIFAAGIGVVYLAVLWLLRWRLA